MRRDHVIVRHLLYDWPYKEALTIEEARNELAFLTVGMYQAPIAVQNGAPIRLTLPWKYGFKSIKYLRKITFVSSVATESGKPPTFWSTANSREYGVRTRHSNLRPLSRFSASERDPGCPLLAEGRRFEP